VSDIAAQANVAFRGKAVVTRTSHDVAVWPFADIGRNPLLIAISYGADVTLTSSLKCAAERTGTFVTVFATAVNNL
jgi:hypothetical protein